MAERKASSRKDVGFGGFGLRLVAALVLVLATYNPSDLSYFDWVRDALATGSLGATHLFVGVLLAIGWTIYGVASFRSLGALGLTLGVAFFVTLVWLLIDFDILRLESARTLTWVVLICLAGLLAIGVTWSHLWRRLTGQYEVDED
jgi:hypothetical protein